MEKKLRKKFLTEAEPIPSQEKSQEVVELDRIAKMLIKRDLALSNLREKQEKDYLELEQKTKELSDSKAALINILEEVDDSRKKAEEEKNKTLAIIANLSDGLLVFDKKNNLSLMNSEAEKIFRISKEEILGKNFFDFSSEPRLVPLMKLFAGEMKELFRAELIMSQDLVVEVTASEIKKDREKIGFVIVVHEITREKEIEKMKSEFVSISAHQLRTPLSAIKWTLRALLDGDAGELNSSQVDLLRKTYASNERLIILINDLLDVTKIEEGKRLFKPSLIDIELIIQFVINSSKSEAERKQLSIEFEKPSGRIPKVSLDTEKIKLALQNLIGNAIRYTPAGGKVTVSLKYDKKEIEIAVKDNGIGITKASYPKIFTKFFRDQKAVRMETEGSGLGLFIAKNIVEAHNGRIWFDSEEGKGTTFYIALPAKEEIEGFLKKV